MIAADDNDQKILHILFILFLALSTEKVELGNVKLASGATSDLTELGIQAHTAPRQPKHATYEGRLRTYQGWPEGLRQTPEMLADAGFYYVGEYLDVTDFHRLFVQFDKFQASRIKSDVSTATED